MLLLICTVKSFFDDIQAGKTTAYKWGVLIFVVYSAFLYYQIIINPQVPLQDLQHAPTTSIDIITTTIMIIMLGKVCNYCDKNINYLLFCKISVLIIVVFLVAYFSKVDYKLYGLGLVMKSDEYQLVLPNNFIDPLRLSSYIGFLAVCGLSIWDKWGQNKIRSLLITSFIVISCLVLLFLIGERGPTLFLLITWLYVMYSKGLFKKKTLLWVVSFLILFGLFYNVLLDFLSIIAPETMGKFENTFETGASSRFGDSDSIYDLSIAQFLRDPFFGSYFRIINSQVGVYPHNIILELLMTFGLVFTIPTICLIYIAVKKSYFILKNNESNSFWAIFFLFILLCRLTSNTIVGDVFFWMPFFFILGVKLNKNHQYGKAAC